MQRACSKPVQQCASKLSILRKWRGGGPPFGHEFMHSDSLTIFSSEISEMLYFGSNHSLAHLRRMSVVLIDYVTIKCGNVPRVALSKLSGDNILLASKIQRQPR